MAPGALPSEKSSSLIWPVIVHVSPATMSLAGTVATEAMPAKEDDPPGSWGGSQTCFAEFAFLLMLRSADTSLGVTW